MGKLTCTTIPTVAAVFALGADPGDEYFVQELASNGIHIADPPSLVGNTGRTICSLLGYDWTVGTASYSVMAEYPDLSDSQARQFVILSQQTYCPDV